ncbi:MAG: type II toxin-antitoxin system HicA family toxin [Anaerolineae bacterium]|nr:type II toxin-antitoxin system HicA family toxin [Anaerolineae bacterium]
MGDPQELLKKARRNRFGWKPRDLRNLYEGFGFLIRSGKGSHQVVSHPKYPDLRATYKDHGNDELPPAYIKTAVDRIDTLLEREKGVTKDE